MIQIDIGVVVILGLLVDQVLHFQLVAAIEVKEWLFGGVYLLDLIGMHFGCLLLAEHLVNSKGHAAKVEDHSNTDQRKLDPDRCGNEDAPVALRSCSVCEVEVVQ